MRCVKCLAIKKTHKGGKVTRIICWDDYQMCAKCCIKYHPERYPLNVINKFLGKKVEIITPKEPKKCKICSGTFFAKDMCQSCYNKDYKKKHSIVQT